MVVNTRNRGKRTEQMLIQSNRQYYLQAQAFIIKQNPEVKTLRGANGKIAETFYAEKSGLDYVGLIPGGQFVTFDAKETANKSSFPLKNIKRHQVNTTDVVHAFEGVAFMIVHFTSLSRMFLLPAEVLKKAFQESENGGSKSIPLKTFEQEAIEVKSGNGCHIDWLSAMAKLVEKTSGP